MSAAFDRAHLHYEQNNGLVGMTKKAFLFFDSITIDLEKPTDPAVRKQSYSTKTHRNGLVSTGTCSLSLSLPSYSHKDPMMFFLSDRKNDSSSSFSYSAYDARIYCHSHIVISVIDLEYLCH